MIKKMTESWQNPVTERQGLIQYDITCWCCIHWPRDADRKFTVTLSLMIWKLIHRLARARWASCMAERAVKGIRWETFKRDLRGDWGRVKWWVRWWGVSVFFHFIFWIVFYHFSSWLVVDVFLSIGSMGIFLRQFFSFKKAWLQALRCADLKSKLVNETEGLFLCLWIIMPSIFISTSTEFFQFPVNRVHGTSSIQRIGVEEYISCQYQASPRTSFYVICVLDLGSEHYSARRLRKLMDFVHHSARDLGNWQVPSTTLRGF